MKNTLLALLGLILLTRPLAAIAQFTYTTNNGTITITGYTGPGGAVTIPATTNGLPVTTIGNNAFALSRVTSVTIPNGVTSIEAFAFYVCTGLTNVAIPGTLTTIWDDAFDSCANLASVAIPGSVTSIWRLAFYNCTSLKTVSIGDGVTSIGIGGYAFYNCASLTNVAIPASVNYIGPGEFDYCTSLVAISVDAANASYSSLDGVLFDKSQTTLIQCPGGKAGSYSIPNTVTSIGDFHGCASLTSINIPGSITSIGEEAFRDCTGLTRVTISDGVTSIGGGAFNNCTSLANITIPTSVTSFGDSPFLDCTSLKGAFFKGNAPADGWPFSSGTNTIVYYLPGTSGWGATFAGCPAVLWNPLMQSSRIGPAGFGFNITGTADIPIVIEAATSLANATWLPLQSLNLTNGAFYFSDPNWTNYPARFYRIRSP